MSRRIYWRREPLCEELRSGAPVRRALGSNSAAAIEPAGWQGGVRLLLRRDSRPKPAENFASPGVSQTRRRGCRAARREVGALQNRCTRPLWRCQNPARNPRRTQRRQRHAGGPQPPEQNLLRPTKGFRVGRSAGADRRSGARLFVLVATRATSDLLDACRLFGAARCAERPPSPASFPVSPHHAVDAADSSSAAAADSAVSGAARRRLPLSR